jgi:hypothetical protein
MRKYGHSTLIEYDLEATPHSILFSELLRPTNGSSEKTLEFIKERRADAGFDFAIFSLVRRLPNGKNPYGLNGCMAPCHRRKPLLKDTTMRFPF